MRSTRKPGASDAFSGFSRETTYYLAAGPHIHKLRYDPIGQNIEVTRYVQKTAYRRTPIQYRCLIKCKGHDDFTEKNPMFLYPALGTYNWNYADRVVSGHETELVESLRYWRTRFVLIPMGKLAPATCQFINPTSELLSDEELRVSGLLRFLDFLKRFKWQRGRAQKGKSTGGAADDQPLRVVLTTLNPTVYVASEVLASKSNAGTLRRASVPNIGEKLNMDAKLPVLLHAMRHPVTGLKLQDRRWHLRLYENVFVGFEAVDWFIYFRPCTLKRILPK